VKQAPGDGFLAVWQRGAISGRVVVDCHYEMRTSRNVMPGRRTLFPGTGAPGDFRELISQCTNRRLITLTHRSCLSNGSFEGLRDAPSRRFFWKVMKMSMVLV